MDWIFQQPGRMPTRTLWLALLPKQRKLVGMVFLWDGLFAKDQPTVPVVDPWIALAAIAIQTHHIRIGAMLTPLPRRRPWQVARQTVALDHLSNGRLVFGAGLCYQALDFTPFGEVYDPKIRAEQLDEGLEVLKGLWSGETFSFQGKHYQIDEVTLLPKPLQSPRIPVWLAGGWPRHKPLRREAADPFDVAVNGELLTDPRARAEMIQRYREAGATWWIELEPPGQSFEKYRAHIRQGPPSS
jgi:alkanesulfonate monooxygenase SsuD/methylene tetrahydromethanopterin reductase-like flavin-dependent oxidoreductase (luciferase family)